MSSGQETGRREKAKGSYHPGLTSRQTPVQTGCEEVRRSSGRSIPEAAKNSTTGVDNETSKKGCMGDAWELPKGLEDDSTGPLTHAVKSEFSTASQHNGDRRNGPRHFEDGKVPRDTANPSDS